MSKKEEKTGKTNPKESIVPKQEGQQVKFGVFEEDDYFEEFEIDSNELNRRDTSDFRQWQEAWEDEEINDHFDTILKKELEQLSAKNQLYIE